jgi:protein SCO1/2
MRSRPPSISAGAALVVLLLTLPPAVHAQGSHDDHHAHGIPAAPGETVRQREDGLSIPDVAVLTQDGREVRFWSDLVAGKVVAMNFVFTTCTTVCPPLGANFGKLQQLLKEGAGSEVRLISVSVDPVMDTPERLAAWGELFGAGDRWTLVTGDKTEVTRLLKALQVFTPDIRDHAPVVLLGDARSGRWTRTYGLAPPQELAALLEELAAARVEGGAR